MTSQPQWQHVVAYGSIRLFAGSELGELAGPDPSPVRQRGGRGYTPPQALGAPIGVLLEPAGNLNAD